VKTTGVSAGAGFVCAATELAPKINSSKTIEFRI